MKNIEDFETIYEKIKNKNESKLSSVFLEYTNNRSKIFKYTSITCLIVDIIIIFLAICIVLLINQMSFQITFLGITFISVFISILILDFIVFIIYCLIFSNSTIKYIKLFKEYVIKDLLSYFYTNLKYSPKDGILQQIYDEVDYNDNYNNYSSEDYLSGLINDKYEFQMAEVFTKHINKDTDSIKFRGLFYKINLNKSIKTNLKIRENATISKANRLEMDSQEFEEYFDVSSKNKIIGMQLLTSDIMEKLIQFYKNNGIKFDITINNNYLYIRLHCGSIFEIGNFKEGAIPKNTLNTYYNILKFVNELTDELINVINITEV